MSPTLLSAFRVAICIATCLVFTGDGASAEEAITVRANMARVLRIDHPAATVIIGNPAIADVTIQDPSTLVLTGKSYGQTNMIILDANGEPITDTMVEVVQATADIVTVYQRSARTSLSCTPACQPTIMLGDDPDYTSRTISSSTIIEGATH